MRRHLFAVALGLSVAAAVLPLWTARHLPAVDLPQHLFLTHVLGNLDEPSLPYAEIYEARPGLTYLTFYYFVAGVGSLLGEETALRLWLTLVLGAIPLALAALLRALGRSPWLALLACPILFTDSFYWGLVSFQSSLALTLLTMAAFVRSLEAPAGTRESRLALAGCAASLLLLQLTHAAGMIFPALALPVLALLTPSDLKRRLRTAGAIAPGVVVFLAWLLAGVGKNRQYGEGPWKASGPLLDPANFSFEPLARRLPKAIDLLANGFWSWADRPPLWGWFAVGALCLVLGGIEFVRRRLVGERAPAPAAWTAAGGPRPGLRPAALFALAAGCYLLLPSDINGYMYYIYPRYAQVAALLAIPLLPFPSGWRAAVAATAAVALAVAGGLHLSTLFRRFDAEAAAFEQVIVPLPERARVMHLVTSWGSRVATHAVYLHYAALAALRRDGVPSFSLATDPSFPVGYRPGAAPPAPPWEWRPETFSWDAHGRWYDCFLVRSQLPVARLFGEHLAELEQKAAVEQWQLWCRRP